MVLQEGKRYLPFPQLFSIFLYCFLLTVDFFLVLESPFFLCALMLLTSEFFTPSLFFFALAFFAAPFFGALFFVATFLVALRFVLLFLEAPFLALLLLIDAFLVAAFFFVAVAITFSVARNKERTQSSLWKRKVAAISRLKQNLRYLHCAHHRLL